MGLASEWGDRLHHTNPYGRRRSSRYATGRKAPRHRAGFRSLIFVLLALCSLGRSALAEPTTRDLQILARALGFLEVAPRGIVEVGIVYPQQSIAGRAEADRIAEAFGDGLRAGNLTLRPKLVALESVGQAGTVALLLTESATPYAAAVARMIAGRSILTLTMDRALIEAGSAVMAVRSEPRVEILVSRPAAQAAGITFAAAFRMMIQER